MLTREPVVVTVQGRFYKLRRPTVSDHATYKRELMTAGARQHTHAEMLGLVRRGVETILPDDDETKPYSIGLVDEAIGRMQSFISDVRSGAFDEMPPEEQVEAMRAAFDVDAELAELSEIIREHFRPYARAVADNAVFHEIAARVAVELFLEDAEGLGVPYRRSFKGLAGEVVEAIPQADLPLIFDAFTKAVELSESEKKGSGSPGAGSTSRTTSKAKKTPRKKVPSNGIEAGI